MTEPTTGSSTAAAGAEALFFTPVFVAVPAMATAPALLIVGAMMMEGAKEVEWDKLEEAIPAFLTVVLMPLTYSIAHGISAGIVSYTVLRLLIGRYREIHPITAVLTVLLILYYAFSHGGGPPTH